MKRNKISVSDPANLVNPDPDPGLKKLFKNEVLKIEFKWTFLN